MACSEAKLIRTFAAILAAAAVGATGAVLTGCDRNDTPGEHIDEAIDEANDAIDEAVEETDEAIDEAAEEIDEANDDLNREIR